MGNRYDRNHPLYQSKYAKAKALIKAIKVHTIKFNNWCKAYHAAMKAENQAQRDRYEHDRQQALIWWGMLK